MSKTTAPNEQVEALAEETFTTMMRVDWARESWPRHRGAGDVHAQPAMIGPAAMSAALLAHNLCPDPWGAALPEDGDYSPATAMQDADRILARWGEVEAGSERQNEIAVLLLPMLSDVARGVRRYVELAR